MAAGSVPRSPLSSSHLADIGYDAEAGELHVGFVNGSVYRYRGVSPSEYEAVLRDPSRGSSFHRVIRSRKPGERIS